MATATPWNSLAGRSAGDINFENTVRQWQAKTDARLQNPGLPDVAVAPGWDAFFGGLQRTKDTAAANGMGFKVNTSEMGQDAMPAMAPSYYSPQGTAYYNGLNKQLSDDTAQFKLNQSAVLMADAQRRSQADAMMQDYVNRDAVSRAMQPGLTRDQSLAAAGPMAGQVGQMYAQQDAAKQAEIDKQAALAEKAAHDKATEAATPVALSPQAIEDNARLYNQTGAMPALGMKDPGNRQLILNKAAELRGGVGSVAADKASYKADSGSLMPLQKQRDAVGAFEGTALKNMQMFIDQAGKVVDSGSPMLNAPARLVSGKMIGSPDQAGYEAARQVALTEIAKVVNNPNLSGQLSDSARGEIMKFSPDSATLAQTVNVARILKQDMANRRTELDRQIGEVKGRIAAPAGAPAGAKQIGKYSVVVH